MKARLPGALAIDIGANVGNHALYYALNGARVLAFEPNPAVVLVRRR